MANKIMKKMTDKARAAARELALLSAGEKNFFLKAFAAGINSERVAIKKANQKDIALAVKKGRTPAFIDRLKLDDKRINGMIEMAECVARLSDPVGEVMERVKRPNGLVIEKVRVPIGVIGIIYESRPNVTADCAALCIKSGNAVILRGGSDSIFSNKAVFNAMRRAVPTKKLHEGAFLLVEDTSHKIVDAMLEAVGGIDLIMPRGGEELINEVVRKSRIPVIKHYKGICHVYVDSDADLAMAEKICYNAKVQRPGVCNAMETMLVHKAVAAKFLPAMAEKFLKAGVRLKGCPKTARILSGKRIEKATDKFYATEYLDLILNIKVVDSLLGAVNHITKFGSAHSDAIVTKSKKNAALFTSKVDSAAVYVNASTRFTDGGEFGKGAEIGISTDKLHARGPMGLEELTSYKYVVTGNGQIRQ